MVETRARLLRLHLLSITQQTVFLQTNCWLVATSFLRDWTKVLFLSPAHIIFFGQGGRSKFAFGVGFARHTPQKLQMTLKILRSVVAIITLLAGRILSDWGRELEGSAGRGVLGFGPRTTLHHHLLRWVSSFLEKIKPFPFVSSFFRASRVYPLQFPLDPVTNYHTIHIHMHDQVLAKFPFWQLIIRRLL